MFTTLEVTWQKELRLLQNVLPVPVNMEHCMRPAPYTNES